MSVADKVCMVCGDRALGYNFNAITCESCKAFFRRNALSNKELTCPFSEKCEITVITRRFCQRCRLEKCFNIGMRKEYIMSEEDKMLKRKKIEQNRAKRKLKLNRSASNDSVIKVKKENDTNAVDCWYSQDNLGDCIYVDTSSYSSQSSHSPIMMSSCTNPASRLSPIGSSHTQTSPPSYPVTPSPIMQFGSQHNYPKSPIRQSPPIHENQPPQAPLQSRLSTNQTHEQTPSAFNFPPKTMHVLTPKNINNAYAHDNLVSSHPTVESSASEIVDWLIKYPNESSKLINHLMPNPKTAMEVLTKVMSSQKDAMRMIGHLIGAPGDALKILGVIMNSPSNALLVFTKFMASPTYALEIIAKCVNSPIDVLQFIQQLMSAPENAVEIMNKFMNYPAEAMKMLNDMVNSSLVDSTTKNEMEDSSIRQQSPVPTVPPAMLQENNNNNCHKSKVYEARCEHCCLKPHSMGKHQIDEDMLNTVLPNGTTTTTTTTTTTFPGGYNDYVTLDRLINRTNSMSCDNTMPSVEKMNKQNSFEEAINDAINMEYKTCLSNTCKELNDAESAKLCELVIAYDALYIPLDEDISPLVTSNQEQTAKCKKSEDPKLLTLINLTAIAVKRLIKMVKKVNSFKSMCQEDQVALLKGGCTEMMILRSIMNYDIDRSTWCIPHKLKIMSSIRSDVLKLANNNVYDEYENFIRTFDTKLRKDENIILIMSAIVLFTPTRPTIIHKDVVMAEQYSYYYLLRRYLESIYAGCEAKSLFLKLIQKINELQRLKEVIIAVYLDVNPNQVEPLLREIFDLTNH